MTALLLNAHVWLTQAIEEKLPEWVRHLSAPLMTHDKKIIAYAQQGYLDVEAV